jgi:outer membrane protein assembly factor BamB
MKIKNRVGLWLIFLFAVGAVNTTTAADWPMWRGDVGRSGATSAALPGNLRLKWSLELPPLKPAWQEDARLQFDAGYQPIVLGKRLIVASSRNDSVTAYDTESGQRQWRFFADGPVRLAPIGHNGKLYFGADDGCVYCLDASSGKQLWKFFAAPGDRRVLGNERLISVWPVRGGLLIDNGKLYFTAGVWPFEGTLLYTLDAERGTVLKTDNLVAAMTTPTGEVATAQDRCPQGYLALSGSRLYVPCGRANPSCFDIGSGMPVALQYNGSKQTDYQVTTSGKWLVQGDTIFDVDSRRVFPLNPYHPVTVGNQFYFAHAGEVFGLDIENQRETEVERGGKMIKTRVPEVLCRLRDDCVAQIDLKAGNRLYGHSANVIYAIDLPTPTEPSKVSWRAAVEGDPVSMLAADDKLFVVTREGSISCFAANATLPVRHEDPALVAESPDGPSQITQRAQSILQRVKTHEGYGLVLGIDSAELIEQLAIQSQMHLVVVDADADKVDQLRQRLDAAGLYGTRVSAIVADPLATSLPPYMAELIVAEGWSELAADASAATIDAVFQSLRPYGGTAILGISDAAHAASAQAVASGRWPSAQIDRADNLTQLTRVGKLPGSADWTHEYGDVGNSLMSQDQLVKAPLGVLWFGGPSSNGALYYDRHEWGPSAAIIEGRMLIQGPQKFTAIDVYTGRILWQLPLPNGNAPGRRANWRPTGFHFVAGKDDIYLTTGGVCWRIEAATGKVLGEFNLAKKEDRWGRMLLVNDLLVVSIFSGDEAKGLQPTKVVALDRKTGAARWTQESRYGFPMMAIGNDKVFCYEGKLDGLFTGDNDVRVKGIPKAEPYLYLRAFDINSGDEIWQRTLSRIATWVAYSESQDVLLVSNKSGVEAWQGVSGKELWSKQQEGLGFAGHPENYWDRLILWKDQAIDQRGPGRLYNLLTGEPTKVPHPLTGESVPWEFTKSGHHCNYAIANEHLMTFRAASAGFCDLSSGGTGRLDGFRSGCRNSLIPANGVLNAPNFAFGCSCGYSIFTSLSLIHVPSANFWTYGSLHRLDGRAQRMGVNFGAPGDRHHDDTLWLGCSAKSGEVAVTLQPAEVELFSVPLSQLSGDGMAWVCAYGVQGVESIQVPLVGGANAEAAVEPKRYTVRLYFAEPKSMAAGERVFDVVVGDQELANVDIAGETGQAGKMLVKELKGVTVERELTIRFKAKRGKPLVCGVEVIAEP